MRQSNEVQDTYKDLCEKVSVSRKILSKHSDLALIWIMEVELLL